MSEAVGQSELENRVLELLGNEKAAAGEWIAALDAAKAAGAPSATREWAGMAQEALAKAGDVAGGIELLKWRAENTPADQMNAKDWLRAADVVAGSNPHLLALIQEAGFGQKLAARECVRRFRLLYGLRPGALCLHRTWGFGVVQKSDALYKKIEIDFRGRPGHGLAMKVAAETIEALADDHLLARLHRDRDGVQKLVQETPAAVRDFLQGAAILPLLHDLPARDLTPALEFCLAQDAAATRAALLGQLKHLHFGALQAAMELLLKNGADEDCRQIYADACATHLVRQEMLLWILRNPQKAEEWDLPTPTALAPLALEELEQDYMGDRLKTQKLLRENFEDEEWLRLVFDGMTLGRQNDFFKRLNGSTAWPGLDRQVMQAKVLKLYPHLHGVITGDAAETPVATYGTVTSHRSYRERQEQLEKLINVDIPANSKEIAVARSYGDLRENFEYKAAKDMQRVLMARRAELEKMMAKVRPSDFSEAPKGVAGVGTTVTLEYPGGHVEHFHILGEWDQQPEKHVISSNTRMAKALAGKKAGEKVAVPTEEGTEVECTLLSVEELPAEIKEWVK